MTPWLHTTEDLASFLATQNGRSALAIDSEADGLYHYREKVCLLQLATPTEARLVDTLAVRDLSPLRPVFADPAIVKILHGADYDVTSLKRDFGVSFSGLFDTMLAARFLGETEVGLQAVARTELGVSLSKANQTDDWSRRPLSPAQVAYALADVQHLHALHASLRDRLAAKGRLSWVEEESAAVAALPPQARDKDPNAWQRVKGARRLDRRALAVLRSVHTWREVRAEAQDVPPFKVLGTEPLLTICTTRPTKLSALRELKGLSPRVRGDMSLLVAVAEALAIPDRELPVLPRSPRPVVPEAVKRRDAALKAWRREVATREGLDVSVILPQRLIDALAAAAPRDHAALVAIPGIRRWRATVFGNEMLALLGSQT